jgi:hypothetical protein
LLSGTARHDKDQAVCISILLRLLESGLLLVGHEASFHCFPLSFFHVCSLFFFCESRNRINPLSLIVWGTCHSEIPESKLGCNYNSRSTRADCIPDGAAKTPSRNPHSSPRSRSYGHFTVACSVHLSCFGKQGPRACNSILPCQNHGSQMLDRLRTRASHMYVHTGIIHLARIRKQAHEQNEPEPNATSMS